MLPYVQRPPRSAAGLHTEALHRVVYWHGDHLRTQALRVVPEHADGLRPTSRPGPKHRAMPATTPPGIAAGPATAAPDATPGILAPDDQRPRWRPGDRMEHLFEQRCDATPHHPAVEPENGPPLTFAELDARANRLARHLRGRGIGAGDRVALMFDDAVWAYTAMLAALKVGAAFVPLDPGFPADRVGYIVSDAAASAVLTLEHLRADLDEMQADVLCVDDPAARLRALPPGRLTPAERGPASADQLAYIIYTSGSTGRPKGVAIDHPSIVSFVRVAAEVYGVRLGDRMYQGMTIAFDFSVEEIWVPWAAGATLVPKPAGGSLLGADLHDFLLRRRVTAMACVPTLLSTIEEDLPDLRFLLVSGEACPHDLIVRWHKDGRRFLNVYGPTEATVTATWTPVDPDRAVTIGVPLPTYSVVVLDPEDPHRALPLGGIGELGIGGIGLARGYVNRDDLTEKAFIPDFIGLPANPSKRIYRTGDLCRINEQGEIEYHGRIDLQVKIRGYRIELTEIESVLLQVPGVSGAVVHTYEPVPGTVELVGYYSLRTDTESVDPEAIYAVLRDRLPSYMVPAYLEQLDVIPLTTSDKADRKNLPPPSARRASGSAREHVDPVGPVETALAGRWGGARAREGLRRRPPVRRPGRQLPVAGPVLHEGPPAPRPGPGVDPRGVPAPDGDGLGDAAAGPPGAGTPAHPAAATTSPVTRVGALTHAACGTVQLLLFLASLVTAAKVLETGYLWVVAASGVVDAYLRALAWVAGNLRRLHAAADRGQVAAHRTFAAARVPRVGSHLPAVLAGQDADPGQPLDDVHRVAAAPDVPARPRRAHREGRGRALRAWPRARTCSRSGRARWSGEDSSLLCFRAEAGRIRLGAVTLGANVIVSEKTVLDIDTAIGDGGWLGHCSSLQPGQRVPAGQYWHGSPAQPADEATPRGPARALRHGTPVLVLDAAAVQPVPAGPPRLRRHRRAAQLVPWTAKLVAAGAHSASDPVLYAQIAGLSLALFYGGMLTAWLS